jgi:SAM-dependent methyltransferase
MTLYGTLAEVYEWLLPDELLEPAGSAAAFAGVLEGLPPGARVLDCAAGTGQLAVGLAQRRYAVTATDASGPMIERTRELAAAHGVSLQAEVCAWEELASRGWDGRFDAVFCVGNSLTHAAGEAGRRTALAGMAAVLAPEGRLLVTSRNWERLRAARPGLEVGDRLVQRHGGRGLVVRAWTISDGWEEPHAMEVAVAIVDPGGTVRTRGERMPFWPFRHEELEADLRAAGLTLVASTYTAEADRYLVRARRAD